MIVIADYNSTFFVIENLTISQSLTIFNKCKNIFLQNGTQKGRITAADQLPVYQLPVIKFYKSWDFKHQTVSSHITNSTVSLSDQSKTLNVL